MTHSVETHVTNTPDRTTPTHEAMITNEESDFPFHRNVVIPPLLPETVFKVTPSTLAAIPAAAAFQPQGSMLSSVKLDNIKVHKGQENYETWASQVSLVFYVIGAKSLILDNLVPANMSDDRAESLRHQALLVFIQLVSGPIMGQIAHFTQPHEIWAYLRESYYPESYYSFVHQMDVVFSLKQSLDASKPIATFIHKFEEEWVRLYQLASSGSSKSRYRKLMKEVLEQDEAKRDWLLSSLVSHYPNAVDNLLTKDKLTYAELKLRLHALSSNVVPQNGTALIAMNKGRYNRRFGDKKSYPSRSPHPSKPNELSYEKPACTWCKSRGHRFEGHTWKSCRKLKKEMKPKPHTTHAAHTATHAAHTAEINVRVPEAHVTVAHAEKSIHTATVGHSLWKFDTAASAHMTSDIGHFEQLSIHNGSVRVGGNALLDVEGKGTVILRCYLPQSRSPKSCTSVNLVRLHNVLFVPQLGHSLVSWNALKCGYRLSGQGDNMCVYSNDTPVFTVKFDHGLPYVQLSSSHDDCFAVTTRSQSKALQISSSETLKRLRIYQARRHYRTLKRLR